MYQQTEFFVFEHDQGTKEEVDSWATKKEALARIAEIENAMALNPSHYRHLADPYWSVEKRLVTYHEPYITSWAEWENC